jgi:adenylate cyclase
MKNPLNSLTGTIVIPFLSLTLGVTSFVIWLSDINTQNSVNKVVDQLSLKASEQANKNLRLYLKNPHLANQVNANNYKSGSLKLEKIDDNLIKYFLQQLETFNPTENNKSVENNKEEFSEQINNVYIGNESDDFVGAEYDEIAKSRRRALESDTKTNHTFRKHNVDKNNNIYREDQPDTLFENNKKYKPTDRDWYKDAKLAGRPVWSKFYIDRSTSEPTITAALPIYKADNNKDLLGVFGSDLLLSEINQYIFKLAQGISKNSLIFIVDSDGGLITTSQLLKNYKTYTEENNGSLNFIEAKKIGDFLKNPELTRVNTLIKSVAEKTHEKRCTLLNKEEDKSINIDKEKYVLNSFEIRDSYGLDWCVFVAIPQSDFMEKIQEDTKNSIIIYGFLLIGTTAVILFIAHRIANPILRLADSAKSLSGSIGTFTPNIEVKKPSELNILTNSFNAMGTQLKTYFEQLNETNKSLEKSNRQLEEQKNELEKINQAYSLFIPQKFLEILGKRITELDLGDSIEARMSILFSDIRDFTSISEDMSPEDNFRFINNYLRRMEPAISENYGFIDKYIGDAIMAIFDGTRSSNNAIKSGISMLTKLNEYNEDRKLKNLSSIRIGIGIHTGNLKLGTVGGESRMDTTVISKNVNLASRLESLTKKLGVSFIVSEETLLSVSQTERKEYSYRRLAPVMPIGINNFIRIYEICNADEPNVKEYKMAYKDRFEQALGLYEAEKFELARQIFEEITEACPEDKVADLYKKCCEQKRSYRDEFGR